MEKEKNNEPNVPTTSDVNTDVRGFIAWLGGWISKPEKGEKE